MTAAVYYLVGYITPLQISLLYLNNPHNSYLIIVPFSFLGENVDRYTTSNILIMLWTLEPNSSNIIKYYTKYFFFKFRCFLKLSSAGPVLTLSILDSGDPARPGRPAKTGNILDYEPKLRTHHAGWADWAGKFW